MKKHQHPQFLLEVLHVVERLSTEIGNAARHVIENDQRCITDQPNGTSEYRHICTLPNGTIIGIHRVNPNPGRQSEGLQLEICHNERRVRVPREEPYIQWSPDDDDLPSIAANIAPYVLSVLAELYEVDHQDAIGIGSL